LQSLLDGLGPEPGVCLVVLHHTAPDPGDALPSILGEATQLPVEEIEQGQRPIQDSVLVVPPATRIELQEDGFHLRKVDRSLVADIVDDFFSSLADTVEARGVGVVLSGALTAGTSGLRDIHLAGGVTIAQDEASCVVFGMPREAIALGGASEVVALDAMASRMMALVAASGRAQRV
jgi:two-component system chemotaxis response regulator CheB